jgi:glycerophosphoryl diester phosphodiesterase
MTSLTLCAMTIALAAGPAPEIIAHRGESFDAPENTLAAFRLAWERDVPAVELDVHLTADDKLAIIHDADTERTGGVKHIVKTSKYADLKEIDVGRWKGEQFAGEKIALLEDALAILPPGKRLVIEVKVGPEAVPALVRAVRSSGLPAKQLVVISFKDETIAEVRKQLPELEAYWLVSFKQNEQSKEWTPKVDEIVSRAKEINAHGVSLSYKGPIDEAFVKTVRDAGLRFYVWTVDDPEVARRFVKLGVDGITTNKAQWMREQLAH